MATLPGGALKPEEEELERKKVELAGLEAELSDRELELATFRAELDAFERRYLHIVGRRYAELDEIEAQIAEAEACKCPLDRSVRDRAAAYRLRASESVRIAGSVEPIEIEPRFTPSESLKKAYREAAKAIHPDLATCESERTRRQRLMIEVNRAYAEGDEERLVIILREWESSPERVRGEGPGPELIRVIRKIAQAHARLRAIGAEIQGLRESELAQLKAKVEAGAAEGRNLLAELATELDTEIANARLRLDEGASEIRQ